MSIVGGLDMHRKQITFDYLDTMTGALCRGKIMPADRLTLREWLGRFADYPGLTWSRWADWHLTCAL